jgi:hypothetical protein
MAIVCKDREDAGKMRNFCDKLHAELSVGKKLTQPTKEEADQLNQVVVIGVLTLEDVIERILQIDIADEKDRERAVQVLQMRTLA